VRPFYPERQIQRQHIVSSSSSSSSSSHWGTFRSMSAKAEEIHSFIVDEQGRVLMFLHYKNCGVNLGGGGGDEGEVLRLLRHYRFDVDIKFMCHTLTCLLIFF
jgi:hypothetical protein